MTNRLYRGDLPEGLDFGTAVAVDTEAMGLNPYRDRLCLVQLSAGDGDAHLVQFAPGARLDEQVSVALRKSAAFTPESVIE